MPESRITPNGLVKRRTREAHYEAGSRQRKFIVRRSAVARLDELKAIENLPNRDLVIARLLRKASILYDAADVIMVPPNKRGEELVQTVSMISNDLVDYIDDVIALHPRGTRGRVLESLLRMIPNLDPPPMQLTMPLFLEESVVSR